MSRIEIPLKEYQGMKDKIESLEKEIANKNKELEGYKEKYSALKDILENIVETSIFERLFSWNKICKEFLKKGFDE